MTRPAVAERRRLLDRQRTQHRVTNELWDRYVALRQADVVLFHDRVAQILNMIECIRKSGAGEVAVRAAVLVENGTKLNPPLPGETIENLLAGVRS